MTDHIPDLDPSMDDEIGFGKYADCTWEQVLDKDANYIRWVVDNCANVSDEIIEMLEDALENDEFGF